MNDRTAWFGAAAAMAVVAVTVAVSGPAAAASAQTTTRASVSGAGVQSDGESGGNSFTADGRLLVFTSRGTNLVPGDTNDTSDVFVKDLTSGAVRRVSLSSDGAQGNDLSAYGEISGNGRYVAFGSLATTFAPGDTNGHLDVFLRDLATGSTRRVNVAMDGAYANGYSYPTGISADGRYVSFMSGASNLVPDDTNERDDVFVRDTRTGTTVRVSVGSDGAQGDGDSIGRITPDGRYALLSSYASNLVSDDTNEVADAFVRDLRTGVTERVSVSSDGTQGNSQSSVAGISANGRFVTLSSDATNLVPGDVNGRDVFLRDRRTGTTSLVSVSSDEVQANDYCDGGKITDDGRYVVFQSWAANLIPNDVNTGSDFVGMDVFLRDLRAGTTELMSLSSAGVQAQGENFASTISPNGARVAFTSAAANLVPGDTNDQSDVFVRTLR